MDDVKRMLVSINGRCDPAPCVTQAILDRSFERWWPDLKSRLGGVPRGPGNCQNDRTMRRVRIRPARGGCDITTQHNNYRQGTPHEYKSVFQNLPAAPATVDVSR